jgi:hypothetical protein
MTITRKFPLHTLSFMTFALSTVLGLAFTSVTV